MFVHDALSVHTSWKPRQKSDSWLSRRVGPWSGATNAPAAHEPNSPFVGVCTVHVGGGGLGGSGECGDGGGGGDGGANGGGDGGEDGASTAA